MNAATDFLIENFAHDLVLAHERIASLEADVGVYQDILRATLDTLRDLTVKLDEKRAQKEEVTEEFKRFREEALIKAGVRT
jgi:hypothetical protein